MIQNMEKSARMKVVPRVCIIGGKAAPGYEAAKKIIKLCHAVAEKVNSDPDVGDTLKLVSSHTFSLLDFERPTHVPLLSKYISSIRLVVRISEYKSSQEIFCPLLCFQSY